MNTVDVTHSSGTDRWEHVEDVRWYEGVLILRMEDATVSYPAHVLRWVVAKREVSE
jgi:hypothetical protein